MLYTYYKSENTLKCYSANYLEILKDYRQILSNFFFQSLIKHTL